MKIGIMQPYFMPYIGYFQLINTVDKYVIYDDVQYIKGGWVNRNNILLNEKRHLINLLLSGASPNKTINSIDIQQTQTKLIKTIENAYKKAPLFSKVFEVFMKIFEFKDQNLAAFLGNSIVELCNYMSIKTEIIFSSVIEKDYELKGKDKVIYICEFLDADHYINAIGGRTLYDKEDFNNHNIKLQFLETEITPYPQFKNEFVPNLSILDVMMFNSVKDINKMLDNYDLI